MNSQEDRTKASAPAATLLPLPRTNRIAGGTTATEGRQATGVFVLGMHRSGTSALTRILNLMGVELGEQLLGANPGNASGHWESIPIMEVNERVLAALGMSWSDPRTMAHNWLDHDEVVRLLPEARLAAGKEFLQARLWAVKDPRISRLLNFWKAALGTEESIRLTAVIALRHPFEVASSLLRRDEIPLSVGMLLWYLHTVDALRSSHGMARVVVDYSDLMKDWKHELSRIESESNPTLIWAFWKFHRRSRRKLTVFLIRIYGTSAVLATIKCLRSSCSCTTL
jgi:O-antigen biosynthesis protein